MGVGAQAHTALCDKLADYDVVGCLEDSFAPADIHAYKELKARAGKPVVLHHAPMVRSNPEIKILWTACFVLPSLLLLIPNETVPVAHRAESCNPT